MAGLKLHEVSAARGVNWVKQGTLLFLRRPLGFVALFSAYMLLGMLLMASLRWVGPWLAMALLPLMSLGFMVASRAALAGGPVHPGHALQPLLGDAARRKTLLLLCGLYGLLALGALAAGMLLLNEPLNAFQKAVEQMRDVAMASGGLPAPAGSAASAPGSGAPPVTVEQAQNDLAAALNDPRLAQGLLLLGLLGSLLSVPFWHAPALVMWGGQGLAQALFSSTLSLWRAKGAFSLYMLAWLAAWIGASMVAGLLLALLGAPQLATVVGLPLSLGFSAAFYASLWFTFDDCFGPIEPEAAQPLG